MSDKTLELFCGLFRGRADVWGSVTGGSNKEEVTEKNYAAHLSGKTSLGIYPLLDDGTCHFFALDLDEKDFAKAKSIKNQFAEAGIPIYIAMSKGKGYHMYGFAEDFFVAKDVRQVAHRILAKLKISTEVFPKQDMLDETIKYGNYINLPCFANRRQFVDQEHNEIPTAKALPKIKRITREEIQVALDFLPEEETYKSSSAMLGAKKAPASTPTVRAAIPGKKSPGKKSKNPPCIEGILKGTTQGQRDEAAFALARHYLDQGYLPEEVTALLIVWDKANKPPINDPHLLETKVRSAQSGYAFGCASITKGLLSGYCGGEATCQWLKASVKDRKKAGLIREITTYEDEIHMYEEIIDNGEAMFLQYNKQTGDMNKVSTIQVGEVLYVPTYGDEVKEGAVLFPTIAEDYGSTELLVENIKKHILRYCDIPNSFLEFATWYIIMTWVYDKLRTVGYLRFDGDTGTGKSRALDAIGNLCYKPMILSGAITPAPIYRIVKKFRGTLILDEADFRDSSEKSEVVTILNCGFEKGRPVIRCTKDDPDTLQVFACFGPKVFASRYEFQDQALEARCLTHTMEETERTDIPPVLGETHRQREMSLRNQLLMWRFVNQPRIDPRDIEDIDLGRIQPRLKQTSLGFALAFKDMPEVLDRFKTFIVEYNGELVQKFADSFQGRIVHAMFMVAEEQGRQYVTSGLIAAKALEEFKIEIKATSIGRVLDSLNVAKDKRRTPDGKQGRFIHWDETTMRKLRRRYVANPDDYKVLFDTILEPLNPHAPTMDLGIEEEPAKPKEKHDF